jgi:hypothetical protein
MTDRPICLLHAAEKSSLGVLTEESAATFWTRSCLSGLSSLLQHSVLGRLKKKAWGRWRRPHSRQVFLFGRQGASRSVGVTSC